MQSFRKTQAIEEERHNLMSEKETVCKCNWIEKSCNNEGLSQKMAKLEDEKRNMMNEMFCVKNTSSGNINGRNEANAMKLSKIKK